MTPMNVLLALMLLTAASCIVSIRIMYVRGLRRIEAGDDADGA